MRMNGFGTIAIALGVTAAAAAPAHAQSAFSQTLYWGSGLVDIPTAWVSPITGDGAINYSTKSFRTDPDAMHPTINWNDRLNSQFTASVSLFGRAEVGVAAYTSNPELGGFGKLLLVRQSDADTPGLMHWLVPSIAVGARNVGPFSHIDRFGIGYELLPGDAATGNARHVADSLHRGFNTANTFYGVATKTFSLREIRPTWANVDLGLTVGYGNGLFKDNGGLGSAYAKHATGGLFYGAHAQVTPWRHTSLTFMAENNAWDYNVGAVLNYRGVQAGLYLTELGAGSSAPSGRERYIYDYQKLAVTVGWQNNIFALLRGDFLQGKEAALERQRQLLLAQIAQRQQRIAALELEINRYEAQNLLELEQRRSTAEVELREERDSLQRLEERLRRVEQQLPPETTPAPSPTPGSGSTPPSGTTPSTTPSTTPPSSTGTPPQL